MVCTSHVCKAGLQSDRIREKQAMLHLQNKTIEKHKLPVYCLEEMLYVQKRAVTKEKYPGKSEKTLHNFFHVGVIQGISLLKRPSRSFTLVTVMLLLLQCVDLARIHT